MSAATSTHEIARKTLRLLATRKIAPTPENYCELYAEAAGGTHAETMLAPERALRRLATDFPRTTPELARTSNALAGAVAARNWDEVRTRLVEFAQHAAPRASRDVLTIPPVREDAREIARELLEVLAQTLELGVGARLVDHPELVDEVKAFAQRLRAGEAPAWSTLRAQLKALWL